MVSAKQKRDWCVQQYSDYEKKMKPIVLADSPKLLRDINILLGRINLYLDSIESNAGGGASGVLPANTLLTRVRNLKAAAPSQMKLDCEHLEGDFEWLKHNLEHYRDQLLNIHWKAASGGTQSDPQKFSAKYNALISLLIYVINATNDSAIDAAYNKTNINNAIRELKHKHHEFKTALGTYEVCRKAVEEDLKPKFDSFSEKVKGLQGEYDKWRSMRAAVSVGKDVIEGLNRFIEASDSYRNFYRLVLSSSMYPENLQTAFDDHLPVVEGKLQLVNRAFSVAATSLPPDLQDFITDFSDFYNQGTPNFSDLTTLPTNTQLRDYKRNNGTLYTTYQELLRRAQSLKSKYSS